MTMMLAGRGASAGGIPVNDAEGPSCEATSEAAASTACASACTGPSTACTSATAGATAFLAACSNSVFSYSWRCVAGVTSRLASHHAHLRHALHVKSVPNPDKIFCTSL